MIEQIKETYTTPKMRGIKQAITEIKSLDPDTGLTEKGLRRLILTGEIPSVRLGAKYLINMDILNDYLYKGSYSIKQLAVSGNIRKITE